MRCVYDGEKIVSNFYGSLSKELKAALPFLKWREEQIPDLWANTCKDGVHYHFGYINGNSSLPHEIITGDGTLSHGYIIGSSGSGKSVMANFLIMDACLNVSPEHLELYMVDAKSAEFPKYIRPRGYFPHAKIIAATSDMGYVISILQWFYESMIERNDFMMNSAGASKVEDYTNSTGKILPARVLIIDEFGALCSQASSSQLKIFIRLLGLIARLGRNAQYFLLFMTQDPPEEVDSAVLSNFGIKVCLKCTTSKDAIKALGNDAPLSIKLKGWGYSNTVDGEKPNNKNFRIPFLNPDDFTNIINELCNKCEEMGFSTFTDYYNDKIVRKWKDDWKTLISKDKLYPSFLLGHKAEYIPSQWHINLPWKYEPSYNLIAILSDKDARDKVTQMLIKNIEVLAESGRVYITADSLETMSDFLPITSPNVVKAISESVASDTNMLDLENALIIRKLTLSVRNKCLLASEKIPDDFTEFIKLIKEEAKNIKNFPWELINKDGQITATARNAFQPVHSQRTIISDKNFKFTPIYYIVNGFELIDGYGINNTVRNFPVSFFLEAPKYGIFSVFIGGMLGEVSSHLKNCFRLRLSSRMTEFISDKLGIEKGHLIPPNVSVIMDNSLSKTYSFLLYSEEDIYEADKKEED